MNGINCTTSCFSASALSLCLALLAGCESKQRNPYSILTEEYERVASPAGMLEAGAIKRNAAGIFDVIILADSRNAIYNSADNFPEGITPSDSIDICWNGDRLIFLNNGKLIGEWAWSHANERIEWIEAGHQASGL